MNANVTRTIIVNSGKSELGKSQTIVAIHDNIIKNTHREVRPTYKNKGDVDALIEMKNGIRVGIRSCGDPNSKLDDTLKEYLNANCDIIIVACRTSGATKNAVVDTSKKGMYRLIWALNMRCENKSIIHNLNERYVKTVLELFDDILNGKL